MSIVYDELDLASEQAGCDLEVFGSRIMVKEYEARTTSGLYIPDEAKQGDLKSNRGLVVATGPDVVDNLIPGNVLLYGRYCGTLIECPGGTYRIINYEDILGKVKVI